jgi:ABC-type transport system involved in cytochrome c biogenesis permease component
MTALPLVSRELQAEARRSFGYWLRVLGGASVVVAFVVATLNAQIVPSQIGVFLFRSLNSALGVAIWILVPVLTADCISEEKREGTLGLLFLTPLRAHDVVLGKAIIHGLRAATILLAALPVLVLPLILGGVGRTWVIDAIVSHLSALILALSAGLIASVQNTEWTRALVAAEFLGGVFAVAFGGFGSSIWNWLFSNFGGWGNFAGSASVCVLIRWLLKNRGHRLSGPPQPLAAIRVWTAGIRQALFHRHRVQMRKWHLNPWLLVVVFGGMSCLGWNLGRLFVALTVFILTVLWSARHLKDSWQQDLTAPPQPVWVKIFSTSETWQSIFRWNKSRTLDRNPIAWLQEYSWTARLTKWGWCVLILVSEPFAVLSGNSFGPYQSILNVSVMLGLAFSASASFRRERQTGALELLLVTPLQARQLIGGRLWGIWGHFLPAMAILNSCWFLAPYNWDSASRSWMYFGLSSFILLPLIGLYFSLLRMNFLVAWLATCGAGLIAPWVAAISIGTLAPDGNASLAVVFGMQAAAAFLATHQVYESLCRREFSFQYVK